jgi:multiple sugar transport system ATP-binding protein
MNDTDADSTAGRDGYLELRDVRKTYPGGVTAVDGLSLTVRRGELVVLVGPSGCGKSTTLRCIAGLEEPTSGDIKIGSRSVTGDRPEDRDIAMVFQNYALYPHKTARENIGFGLRMTTDLSDAEVATRVEETASTLGVSDLLDTRPKSLSGGQQQRVALGRAIVREPSVFLLDEPLSNLDATLRSRMRTEIQQLQRDLDVTTVYVTHDQVEAMTMGDRIAVLRDGQLQQVGTPLECYYEPANAFVARFIGEPSMNMFDCQLTPTGFEGPLQYPSVPPLGSSTVTADTSAVTLGVRPDAVELHAAGDDEPAREAVVSGSPAGDTGDDSPLAETVFSGEVSVIEPVGDQSFLYVELDAGVEVVVADDGAALPREGTAVQIHVPPRRIHLFDGTTGEAISHPDRGDVTGDYPSRPGPPSDER